MEMFILAGYEGDSIVITNNPEHLQACLGRTATLVSLKEAAEQKLYDLNDLYGVFRDQVEAQQNNLQARIDALMLEYCPDEMTSEQIKNWEKHQIVSE